MCGVFAYAGKEKVDVEKCLSYLAHRGPDNEAVYTHGEVVLGHRRLSIIDLSAQGNQPLESSSGNSIIVFNGEIYNYESLRESLIAQGAVFKTKTDTEVIIAGYEAEGEAFFERLRGMWAFVLYDRKKDLLVASRDPFGIKPLVYAVVGSSIYFASEMKCLKGVIPLKPNPQAYTVFYNLGYFLAPDTPYKGVYKLIPGQVLAWSLATKKVETLRHISRLAGERQTASSYQEAIARIDTDLTASVEAHYVADVPVSILLSGGTDSSLIAALSHKLGKRPTAYHVAVQGSDDTPYAEAVAKHLGIPLVVEHLTEEAIAKQYEKVWSILDEPTADISIIPTSLIYERIKGKAKVVLSGEGGDELFGGYLRHQTLFSHTQVVKANMLNTVLNNWMSPSRVGVRFLNPLIQKIREILLKYGFTNDLVGAYLKSARTIDYPLRDAEVRNVLYELYTQEREEGVPAHLAFDMLAYLPNNLLPKSDIASMASSIEARVPFVDRFVARAVLDATRGMGVSQKKVLKDVLRQYLPESLVSRGKTGFSVSLSGQKTFLSDFHQASEFHLKDTEAFGMSDDMAELLRDPRTREEIVRKYPRFAFGLISSWKCFVI